MIALPRLGPTVNDSVDVTRLTMMAFAVILTLVVLVGPLLLMRVW